MNVLFDKVESMQPKLNSVKGLAQMLSDQNDPMQSRAAEVLTMDYERNRLHDLGIDKPLEWKSLDDCFAGYDVLSYDPGEFAPTNRLIAVKATTSPLLRFTVTRNEWEQAKKVGASYIFHVWDMHKTTPVLYVRTTAQVAVHIPRDNDHGRWMTAEIPLDA